MMELCKGFEVDVGTLYEKPSLEWYIGRMLKGWGV
jgi:hypothetical protein